MKKPQKRTQKSPKRTKKGPEIQSVTFYRNSLNYDITTGTEPGTAWATGYYETAELTVGIYSEKRKGAAPYLKFFATYQGRSYDLHFPAWLSSAAVRRRALKFSRQVVAMAQAQVSRAEFGGAVLPAFPTAPAAWPAKQPELFEAGALSPAHRFDEIDALLNMLQAAADKSPASLLQALSYAKKAALSLRKFYGIPAPATTATA